ncbi:hypothetical protein Tco_0513096, partial [Tanacetum coccineum]
MATVRRCGTISAAR